MITGYDVVTFAKTVYTSHITKLTFSGNDCHLQFLSNFIALI